MKPTVLIFLKAPTPGQAKTRLAAGVGNDRAMEIYGKLVQRQLAAIPAGWPVEVHFAPVGKETLIRAWIGEAAGRSFFPQIEADLGKRLAHAGQDAFRRGAEAVYLIGGDCVGLDSGILRAAAAALEAKPFVMGPTEDGGYYLLGMTAMNSSLFVGIDWGTDRVAEQTRANLRTTGEAWVELPTQRDVDTIEDWQATRHLL